HCIAFSTSGSMVEGGDWAGCPLTMGEFDDPTTTSTAAHTAVISSRGALGIRILPEMLQESSRGGHCARRRISSVDTETSSAAERPDARIARSTRDVPTL